MKVNSLDAYGGDIDFMDEYSIERKDDQFWHIVRLDLSLQQSLKGIIPDQRPCLLSYFFPNLREINLSNVVLTDTFVEHGRYQF